MTDKVNEAASSAQAILNIMQVRILQAVVKGEMSVEIRNNMAALTDDLKDYFQRMTNP